METQLRGAPIGLLSEQPGLSDSNGVTLADILAAGDDPVVAVAQTLLEDQLQNVLATISERETRVIRGRFTGKTQKQLAVELRTSTRTIRKIEVKTLSKLRHPSRSQVLRDYLD
jgi:RNA polymerase sigma factor (sigma-70 family)